MQKRLLVVLFDTASITLAATLVVLIAAPQAHAYVDPSVMTYTIQAVAGVAVALSAVLGVALRRTRKVVFRVLKIDENANKIVEPAVHTIDPRSAGAEERLREAAEEAEQARILLDRGPRVRPLSWPQRFFRALVGVGFLVATVFIVTPLELVGGGADSLNFGFFDVLPIVLSAGAAGTLALALVLSLFRGRVFDIVLTIVVALGLCCYVQSLVLNGPLPVADGTSINLSKFKTITVVGTAVWLAIIVSLLVMNAKKASVCRPLLIGLSLGLLVVQGASVVSVGAAAAERQETNPPVLMTTKGLYDVGAESNVVVFVLDTFDTRLMEDLLASDPAILDDFTGFTYFRNATGSMIPTRYGVPYLLSGTMPQEGQTYQEYVDSRYRDSSFMKDISQAGYDIGIYSDSVRTGDSPYTNGFNDYPSNFITDGHVELNALPLLSALTKMSLYREAPWPLKPLFWFYTDEINRSSISETMEPYIMDDIAYADKLFDEGLEISDEPKAFRFIHLIGAHAPFTMGADGRKAAGETDQHTQAQGSLRVVVEYIQQLKKLDLYDNATIIITSDHGDWYITDEALDRPTTPFLLVKPSETAEEAAAPLKVSDAPTGHLDFNATVINAVGGDSSSYGPTVFEVEPGDRPRFYWMTTSDGHNDLQWREYEIDGDVLDFNDWRLTGATIDIPKE